MICGMRSLLRALAITAAAAPLAHASPLLGEALAADPLPIPKVYLLYPGPRGTIFDVGCEALVKTPINPVAVEEAVRRAPELQALWDRGGPEYLAITFAEIGVPFPYKEMPAALTVCPGVRSMSTPLMLNVRRFLSSAQRRDPDWLFVETVYHELMHTYVRPVSAVSELRKKYATEDAVVLNHLHVMALERLVLSKLERADYLKRIGDDYRTQLAPAHKRAWTIVDEIEGHEPFIKELKELASRQR